MTKKQAPTFSQLSYIVTGILAAHVQHGDELSQRRIEKAVSAAKTAAEAIEGIIGEYAYDEELSIKEDPFKHYPWSGKYERYTDLANYLKAQGVTSNRRISEILHECLEFGYLTRDTLTGKYKHKELFSDSHR